MEFTFGEGLLVTNKKIPGLLIACLLISLVIYAAYRWVLPSEDSALQASGTIEATSVDVKSRLYGTIIEFPVSEGSTVKKGDLLVKMGRSDLLAQEQRDQQGVIAAQAHLQDLLDGSRTGEIKAAAAAVQIASTNLEKSSSDLLRSQQLLAAGAMSAEEYERLETAHKNLESQLEAAQAQLSILEAGARPHQITAAAAEVERSKAVLQATRAALLDLQALSPLDGILSEKYYEPGEFVQAGAILATVTDLDHPWVKVYIPTDDLPGIKLGQKAAVTVSGSQQLFSGEVVYIAPQGEYTPKTIQTKKERTNVVFAVKVAIENHEGILKPGMPADVTFTERGSEHDSDQ